MKRWMLGLLLGSWALLWAQAPSQEVVLSASAGTKVGIALPSLQIVGLEEALVNRELKDVVVRDLEEAGPFAVLKTALPTSTEPSSYSSWVEKGTDWLLICRAALTPSSEVEVVLQVVGCQVRETCVQQEVQREAGCPAADRPHHLR